VGDFRVCLPGCVIPVWATDEDEALSVALGVRETDGGLYGCE
jgi:hypothetical protein